MVIFMEKVINKDMTIKEVIDIDMELAEIFLSFGMFCVGCAMSSGETVEEACQGHGIDVDELLQALNLAIEEK